MDRGGGQRASPHCGPGPAPDRKSLVATSAGWVGHHVLDADIRDYFGSIEHDKLMKLGGRRVSDRMVFKLLRQGRTGSLCTCKGSW